MTLTELFNAIAAAIRSKDGTTAAIPATTFPERIMALSGGGGGGVGKCPQVTIKKGLSHYVRVDAGSVTARVSVSATVEEPVVPEGHTHALYNGVRLPIIPDDVLASYPYCIILSTNSTYKLIMAQNRWFKKSNSLQVIRCPNAEFDYNGIDWGTGSYYTSVGNWPSDSLIWSNYDIPNGSATATEIAFAGTDPVPAD